MKKSDETVMQIAYLSVMDKLPSTFSELHEIIWKSFFLGRDYQLQLQEEKETMTRVLGGEIQHMDKDLIFPKIDKSSWFYRNCKSQRKREAKICQCCPFRAGIEKLENISEKNKS
jgi:hypothetical protein